MIIRSQHTISTSVSINGIGLHTGVNCEITIKPASIDSGIIFKRLDFVRSDDSVTHEASNDIIQTVFATATSVIECDHGTRLANSYGCTVSTVEHLMAALYLLGIDNAVIEVTGPEIPILDGSAKGFADSLRTVGVEKQEKDQLQIDIEELVVVKDGDRWISAQPATEASVVVEIDFGECAIGRQAVSFDLADEETVERLLSARTFCELRDVEALRSAGLIKGGGLDNSIVVDGTKILNKCDLRDPKEFALHKALDLIGDLALAGGFVKGQIRAFKPGHCLNCRMASALADLSANELLRPTAAAV